MKKKINIVLILAVLGLWGTVIYKAVHQYLFPQKIETTALTAKSNVHFNQMRKDTFELKPLNRDPFLNVMRSQPVVTVSPNPNRHKKKTVAVVAPVVEKNWPTVVYYGNVTSKVNNQQLFIVKIDKKIYNIKKNDVVQGLKLRNVYKDSIELLFNKDKKYIKINK